MTTRTVKSVRVIVVQTSSTPVASPTTPARDPAAERAKKRLQEQAIARQTALNQAADRCGQVECAKLKSRFATGDKHWPIRDGFRNFNVCSSSPSTMFRQLSPMKLGPITFRELDADGNERLYTATCIENLWQFTKVWNEDIHADGSIKREWFEWRDAGWADPKPHRHPRRVGKVNYAAVNPSRPRFSLWRGDRLDYLDARVRIYMPLYVHMARETSAYKALEKLVASGTNVQILGYDGYDLSAENRSLADCLADASRPMGHELLLVGMLRNERVWEQHPSWRPFVMATDGNDSDNNVLVDTQ